MREAIPSGRGAERRAIFRGVIKFFVALVLVVALVWCGATVKLGKRTFFGHVRAIWATEEAQDMNKGVREKAGPALEKVKRGVEAGYREATKPDAVDAGGPAPKAPKPAHP